MYKLFFGKCKTHFIYYHVTLGGEMAYPHILKAGKKKIFYILFII